MSSGIDHANQPAPPRALYLAGPLTEQQSIAALAVALRAAGIPIASTWHDAKIPEHPTRDERIAASRVNHRDLDRADAAVFVAHRGQPLETWVEFGAAFKRIPCFVLHHEGQKLPVSADRADIVAAPLEWHDTTTELAWLADRIEAWYGAL